MLQILTDAIFIKATRIVNVNIAFALWQSPDMHNSWISNAFFVNKWQTSMQNITLVETLRKKTAQ